MSPLPLFVFGTLQRGEANHLVIEGRYDRWLPATLRDYRKFTASHGFPTIAPSPGDHVSGELYFLRQTGWVETLRRCDVLEEIPTGTTIGPLYARVQVTVETAQGDFAAWVYVDSGAAASGRA